MTKPFSPEDALKNSEDNIPDTIIATVNTLLAKKASNLKHGKIIIYQDEILSNAGISAQVALDNGWLDFEPLYRKNGWSVFYDRPGYSESYRAHYVFSRK